MCSSISLFPEDLQSVVLGESLFMSLSCKVFCRKHSTMDLRASLPLTHKNGFESCEVLCIKLALISKDSVNGSCCCKNNHHFNYVSASQCLQEKCKLFTCSLLFSPNFPLLSDFCQLSNDLNFVLVLLRFN